MTECSDENNHMQQKYDDNFQNMAEVSSVATLIIQNQMIVYANKAAGTLYNAPDLHLLIRHSLMDLITPRDGSLSPGDEFSSLIIKADEVGDVTSDWFGIKTDGTQFSARISLVPIIWNDLPSFLLTITDITSEERYKKTIDTLIEKNPAGIIGLDKSGIIISVNKTLLDISGFTRNEMIGKNFGDFSIISVTGGGISGVLKTSEQNEGTLVVKFPAGIKTFDERAIPLLDENGEVREILLILIDQTDQVALAAEVKDKVAWYQSILDAVQFPIHVTDMDMNWTYMNKAFEAVLLKNKVITDRESACGLPCYTADATICRTENCGIHQLKTKGVTESYFIWQGMNGKQVTKPVMNAKGEQIGYVETVQDLTDILSVQDYTRKEIERIGENLQKMASGDLQFNLEINQPDQYTQAQYEEFKKMNDQLRLVHDSYGAVITDIRTITDAMGKGDLNYRVDTEKHQGDNKKVIQGLNATVDTMADKVAWYQSILDAVQFPIHVTDMDMNWTFMNKAFETVLLKNKVIKDRESAYGLPCHTADATICKTENCGIHQLRTKGVTESYFYWQGDGW